MVPKILRRCEVCGSYVTSYLAVDIQLSTRYYCHECWNKLKADTGSHPSDKQVISSPAQIDTQPQGL
jgi:hypothetical protein